MGAGRVEDARLFLFEIVPFDIFYFFKYDKYEISY